MMGSSLYTSLIGAILAVVLLFTFINYAPSLLDENVANDPSLDQTLNFLEDANESETTVTLQVPSGGGIAIMDGGNLTYNIGDDGNSFDPANAEAYTHIKGFHMKRPDRCGTDTCVCVCDNMDLSDISQDRFEEMFGERPSTDLPGGELLCREPACAETTVDLKDQHKVSDVFQRTPPDYNSYQNHYWLNSALLLNVEFLKPGQRVDGLPITIGGYADRLPQSEYTVTGQPADKENTVKLTSIR
jgi:hypothetical protein